MKAMLIRPLPGITSVKARHFTFMKIYEFEPYVPVEHGSQIKGNKYDWVSTYTNVNDYRVIKWARNHFEHHWRIIEK